MSGTVKKISHKIVAEFEKTSPPTKDFPRLDNSDIPDLCGFKKIIAGPNSARAAVHAQLKELIVAEGIKAACALPEKVLVVLNDTIQVYREAGYSKDVLDGMRLCVAQALVEKLKA